MEYHLAVYAAFLVFSVLAYICMRKPAFVEHIRNWLMYDRYSTVILFGSASVIFLYKILNLSIADFGEYKTVLFILFSGICILSFYKVRELLSIRGLAILTLFFCDKILDSIYTQISIINIIFTYIIYAIIVIAIIFGSAPYLLRDCIDSVTEHPNRAKYLGYSFLIFAFINLGVIFN